MTSHLSKARRILSFPFRWKKAKTFQASGLNQEQACDDQRHFTLIQQIEAIDDQIVELKKNLRTELEKNDNRISYQTSMIFTRARDLRFKRSLLEAELQRHQKSITHFEQSTVEGRKTNLAQPTAVFFEVAESLLSKMKASQHPKYSIYSTAIQQLSGEDPTSRLSAIRTLEKIKLPESVIILKASLTIQEDTLQVAILSALVKLRPSCTYVVLDEFWYSPVKKLRIAAFRGQYGLASKNFPSICLSCLIDSSPELRRMAVTFCNWLKLEESIGPLIILLKDENTEVRLAAIKALGELKAEQAVYMLIRTLRNDNLTIRRAAREALGNILSMPIEIDIENSANLFSQVTALLKWWTLSRMEGPPWSLPESLLTADYSEITPLIQKRRKIVGANHEVQ
jgi:HEAT repeat protein